MALSRSHDLINLMLLVPTLYFVPREFYLPFATGYLIGTFLLSPDLDLKHSKPSKRWKVFRYLWRPYQSKSKHRGISHVPIVGTFIRIAYLVLAVFLLFQAFVLLLHYVDPSLEVFLTKVDMIGLLQELMYREESFYFLLGLILSEVFHVLIDLISSFLKGYL
ncbi:metal-binding protein [Thermocrinis minervae]|uniref:Uncharacterized metal-binding protein n=1 Tax=Thermocrinis minervae TaxID=381751 RepID=A0A1M6T164_9AQUI|nr:metal-binding protein [Thermocrinis minervae]SHK50725.1 Uncharacterized metal-binding protein [Thermocrinis minervae]